MGVWSLELFSVVSPECFYAESNFYTVLFIKTTGPIAALVIFWLVQVFRIRRLTVRKQLFPEQHHELNALSRRTVINSVNNTLTFLNLILIPVCNAIFKMFSCAEFELEGSFLVAQLDLSCTSEAYDFWKRYALVMVAIFPIGFPVAMFVMMFIARAPIKTVLQEMYQDVHGQNSRHRPFKGGSEKYASNSVLVFALGAMFSCFKPDYYWYGVLMIMVRLLLTSGLLFFSRPIVRITFASFIAFVSFMLQRELMPQRLQADASMAHWCQFCILVWIVCLRMLDVFAPWLLTALGCNLALAWVTLFYRVAGTVIHALLRDSSDSSDLGDRLESQQQMPKSLSNAKPAAGAKTAPETNRDIPFPRPQLNTKQSKFISNSSPDEALVWSYSPTNPLFNPSKSRI